MTTPADSLDRRQERAPRLAEAVTGAGMHAAALAVMPGRMRNRYTDRVPPRLFLFDVVVRTGLNFWVLQAVVPWVRRSAASAQARRQALAGSLGREPTEAEWDADVRRHFEEQFPEAAERRRAHAKRREARGRQRIRRRRR